MEKKYQCLKNKNNFKTDLSEKIADKVIRSGPSEIRKKINNCWSCTIDAVERKFRKVSGRKDRQYNFGGAS